HGGEEVVTDVVRGGKLRAVVATHSHLPGTERRSAIMNMDMRADGPLEIPASYTATIPAPEIIASDYFTTCNWYGGEGWAGDHWGHGGAADTSAGYVKLPESDNRNRSRWCFLFFCGSWNVSEEPAHMVRQADVADCSTDVQLHCSVNVVDFEGDEKARCLGSPDGINWEEVETWSASDNTTGWEPWPPIDIHPGGTVCDLWIRFEGPFCEGHWECDDWSWGQCVSAHWVCTGPNSGKIFIDDVVIKGR
ncbi:MAG: hypothetical protein U9R11_01190, partial [Chloroflexota bacterium]|nr:hypothetical protein [Chloroflexota bacterium]